MSAVVRGRFPFLNKELLIEAINRTGLYKSRENTYYDRGNAIDVMYTATQVAGYFFVLNGAYSFVSAVDERTYRTITDQINEKYLEIIAEIEQKKEEARLKEIEKQRKIYVDNKKKEIEQKAKSMGYQVKEERIGKTIKLVLVKREY
jgi:hypothetical protein